MPTKERLNKMAQVKPTQKKKISGPALAALIVSIVLIVAMIVSLVASSGLFTRIKNGASTENFKINGSMLEYYTASYYQNWYYNNYYYILLGYIKLDSDTPLSEQYVDTGKTTTFAQGVRSYVEQILKYCEAALADSDFNYDEANAEAEQYAKESIESLKEGAKSNEMDLATYIRANFGETVSKSDLEKALVLEHLASDYYSFLYDKVYDNMTDERKTEYFKDNLSSFVEAKYMYFSLSQPEKPNSIDEKEYVTEEYPDGKSNPAYTAAVDAENARVKELNDKKKELDETYIKKFAAAKDVEEFKKLLVEYKYNDDFETAYNTAVKEWLDTDKPSNADYEAFRDSVKDAIIEAVLAGKSDITSDDETTDEETSTQADDADTTAESGNKWESLQKELPKKVITQINTTITNATKTTSYAVSTNLGKWLFGGVKAEFEVDYTDEETFEHVSAKENETWTNSTEITDETQKAYGAYTVNAYIVIEAAHRHEEPTKNVGHILFKVDEDDDSCFATFDEAAAKANEVLEQIKSAAVDGKVSKEVFESFGNEHTADSKVFYENVTDGQMVDEFNDWIYDEARVEGELGLVKTEDYGWHIMYFVGNGEAEWQAEAHTSATSEDIEDWYENLKTTVTVNTSLIKSFLDD